MATEIADLVARIRVDTQDVDAAAQRTNAATQKMVASIQTVSSSLQTMSAQGKEALATWVQSTEQAARAADRLGSGFADVKRQLNISAATAKAGQDLQTLRTAMDAGIITQGQFERATAAMSRQLLVMGGQGPLLERFGSQLQTVARAGIEPIAAISPTAGRALTDLVGRLGPTGLAFGAAAAAGGLFVKSLLDTVIAGAQAGTEIQQFVTRTGASAEALSSIGVAARLAGGNVTDVGQGFRVMQERLTAAVRGSGEAVDLFTRLGVNLREFRTLAPEAQFTELARAIAAIPDPAERATVAGELLGARWGTQLLPLLTDMAQKGLPELQRQARALGAEMSGTTAQASETLTKSLTALEISAGSLGRTLTAQVVGPLTNVVDLMTKVSQQATGGSVIGPSLGQLADVRRQFDEFRLRQINPLPLPTDVVTVPPNLQVPTGLGAANRPLTDLSRPQQNLIAENAAATEAAQRRLEQVTAASQGRILDVIRSTSQQAEREIALRFVAEEQHIRRTVGVYQEVYNAEVLKAAQRLTADLGTETVKRMTQEREAFSQLAPIALAGLQQVRQAYGQDLPNDISSGTARIREVLGLTEESTRGLAQSHLAGIVEIKKYKETLDALSQTKQAVDPENVAVLEDYNRGIEELIRKIEELARKAGITGTELKRMVGDIPGVQGADKTSNRGGAADPGDTAGFATRLGDSFTDVKVAVNEAKNAMKEYTKAQDEAAASGKRLDNILTGNSLDKSALAVGSAFRQMGTESREMLGSLNQAATTLYATAGASDTLKGSYAGLGEATRELGGLQQSLTAEYLNGVPALESLTQQVLNYGRAIAEAKRLSLVRAGLASSGLGSGDLSFTDAGKLPSTYGGNALTGQGGATGGAYTGDLSLASLLALRSPDITGQSRPVNLGGGPGGLRGGFSLNVDQLIGRILSQMLNQAEAQLRADEYIRRHLEPKLQRLEQKYANRSAGSLSGGFGMPDSMMATAGSAIPYAGSFAGGGRTNLPPGMPGWALVHGPEEITPVGSKATPAVVVNLNGLTVLQSREALTELAFAVADIVADQTRRTRR